MSDVYSIGMKIALTNGVSSVLAVIAADMLKIEGYQKRLSDGFSGMEKALLGMGSILGGAAILGGLAAFAKHGDELVHVKQQLLAADVKGLELAQATSKAWEVSQRYGLGVANVLRDIKEARMVFGSTEHAINFIDPLEKMRVVLNSVSEGSGNKLRDSVYEMARAGELKGLQTPEQFVSYFDQMTKAITASGGKVDPKAGCASFFL